MLTTVKERKWTSARSSSAMFPVRTCIMFLILVTGVLSTNYLSDYDTMQQLTGSDDNALRRLSLALRRVREEVKRSRMAACIVSVPGACENINLSGQREDMINMNKNGPGRRRRSAKPLLFY